MLDKIDLGKSTWNIVYFRIKLFAPKYTSDLVSESNKRIIVDYIWEANADNGNVNWWAVNIVFNKIWDAFW